MSYQKPLPSIDPETEVFWRAAKEHRLIIQRCQKDGIYIFYPRAVCPYCMSDQITWVTASGKGKVYSFTVVHQHPNPAFQAEAPYIVALIELDEGVRMMSTVEGSPENMEVGMDVEVVFDDVTQELSLPRFRPTGR